MSLNRVEHEKTSQQQNKHNKNKQSHNVRAPNNKIAVTVSRHVPGANWQQAIGNTEDTLPNSAATITAQQQSQENSTVCSKKKSTNSNKRHGLRYLAMDCEMVGIGPQGRDDMLARVSIVDRNGNVLMDKYVKPKQQVMDYRTSVSGIRACDIANGEDFDVVQQQVIDLLQGKILVGHGLRKDLAVLSISHPFVFIRDTSNYKPLARLVGNGRTPSLKRLAHCVLGKQIQSGEHDSVEDARTAMSIYKICAEDWERSLLTKMRKYY